MQRAQLADLAAIDAKLARTGLGIAFVPEDVCRPISMQAVLFVCSQSGVRHFPVITSTIRVAASPRRRSP
jgi:hypothetical protein